jgi:hypothetical protein
MDNLSFLFLNASLSDPERRISNSQLFARRHCPYFNVNNFFVLCATEGE